MSFSFSIYIRSQLFFFRPNLTVFFSFSLFPSFVRYYLLGSVGPTTKNQPSRLLHDKQVNERTSVRQIISICHPLEVSPVTHTHTLMYPLSFFSSSSISCNRKKKNLIETFLSLSYNRLPTFDIQTTKTSAENSLCFSSRSNARSEREREKIYRTVSFIKEG